MTLPPDSKPTPDDTQRLTDTQSMTHVQGVPRRSSRNRQRRRSTSYMPPLWAIALMLFGVVAVSAAVVALVYFLGGRSSPTSEPRVVIVTAPPTDPPAIAPSAFPSNTPAFESGVTVPLPDFALEGPTLAPVYLSPTPDQISIGRTVLIVNVGDVGLNVREAPGINNTLRFQAPQNSLLTIIDGPQQATEDSFTWWQVRDPFTGQTGWAVDLYMEVQPDDSN